MMKILIAFLFILMLAACTFSGSTATPLVSTATKPSLSTVPPSATPLPPTPTQAAVSYSWWNDTVFYIIFVRSFYDSNGDGIGDFNGLIDKLDYLNDGDPNTITDLGITGIWLMPIFPSPSTHGYDGTDFYSVNPQYGSMDDFHRLVEEAHDRGIRIILDFPLNHTSNQHPWFIQSQNPKSSYRNWYLWADIDPGWKGAWNQQVWYPLNGDYYYSFFWEGMPDLNYTNPAVTAEMEKVTRFWLEQVGIDGFRLDAIGSLIEEGPVTVETKASHDWFAGFYKFIKNINSEAVAIGEVWREDAVVVPWVANHEVDLAFEFDLSTAMLASINDGNSARVLETLRSGTSKFPSGQYGTFLTNHDMTRVMTQLGGDPEKAKAAASLYFSLPGVPFVYYGEEIGMSGEEPNNPIRAPMQWSAGSYAGFSDAAPWTAPIADYATFNVASETGDPNSLLSYYRTLISLRNSHPALRIGDLNILETGNNGLFASLRNSSTEAVLVVINLTNTSISNYRLSLNKSSLQSGEVVTTPLMGAGPFAGLRVNVTGGFSIDTPLPEIPAYATFIVQLSPK